ncbi:MAG: hypothetical protein ACLQBC_10840 [Syntrophales bacterium]
MKKIDFHIHTVPTVSDCDFVFSIERLKKYIDIREIDGIAITNHNQFDLKQFREITEAVSINVFPGIEINLEGGHILIIADVNEPTDFDAKCKCISASIKTKSDSITVSDLELFFPDLSKYLLIPHYDKKPLLRNGTLKQLRSFITAGEVESPKKFKYCLNDADSLVPVYFSDLRIDENLLEFPARQTYIDAGEVNFAAIRTCLRDKNKVFLSREDGHRFFDALDNGLRLSTGLNVILGERSTGKSFTLDRISKAFENVKYIQQFSLLERDEEADKKRFNELLSKRQSLFTQEYLKDFQGVVDSMANVDLEKNELLVEKYISSLIRNAQEYEKADSFSKAQLFNESDFSENESGNLKLLIDAVRALIDNTEYRAIIDRHIPVESLKKLAIELMQKHIEETEVNLKKRFLNDLLGTIRRALQIHTAAMPIEDVDLYIVAMERKKTEKFREVVKAVKKVREILRKDMQGFQIVAKRRSFIGAQELKTLSGRKMTFSDAFKSYDDPYAYLKALRAITELEESDYFKYFTNIEYRILNKHGFSVSGGERSEFRLLQEISDAQQFNMLLIDEPESSFDNLFLMNNVNELIKDISKSIPVVIVTHNNTVGASIKPDYVVYTRKTIDEDSVKYEVYSGFPSDKVLTGLDGKSIRNLDVLLNCLEAGQIAYDERGGTYEILKD